VLPAGLADRRAVDGDNALRRLFESGRDVEQRCLAAAAVAEDGAKPIVGISKLTLSSATTEPMAPGSP